MSCIDNIIIVNPNLDDFKDVLVNKNVDYIGTRLHAGVFAMQNFVRSIILIVDNRARDMKETYNLPAIERDNIDTDLKNMINADFKTEINIDEFRIKEWKKQLNEKL